MNTPSNEPTQTITRQPAFTINESEAGAQLQAALPGVRKEAIKLTLKQSVLRIEAVRGNAVPQDWKTHSGPADDINYQLDVRLASKLNGDNVKATFENGILTLDIPIREEAKPREIFVN